MKEFLIKSLSYLIPKERTALSQNKMLILSILVGFLGVDRYMMGYKNWWLKFITFGGMWVWYLSDIVRITLGKLPMSTGEPLKE